MSAARETGSALESTGGDQFGGVSAGLGMAVDGFEQGLELVQARLDDDRPGHPLEQRLLRLEAVAGDADDDLLIARSGPARSACG